MLDVMLMLASDALDAIDADAARADVNSFTFLVPSSRPHQTSGGTPIIHIIRSLVLTRFKGIGWTNSSCCWSEEVKLDRDL